jgi:hypothetical protein
MPFSAPSFTWDRDDFDLPDDVKDQIKFTGDQMPRDPGDTVTVGDVAFAGGQVKVEHSGGEYELFSYDPDLSTLGGVCVGCRNASGSGGFTLRVGTEDISIPESENCGLDGSTEYFVGWDRTNSTLITDKNRENALGKDVVFLGSLTSSGDTDGGSGTGDDTTGGGTLK